MRANLTPISKDTPADIKLDMIRDSLLEWKMASQMAREEETISFKLTNNIWNIKLDICQDMLSLQLMLTNNMVMIIMNLIIPKRHTLAILSHIMATIMRLRMAKMTKICWLLVDVLLHNMLEELDHKWRREEDQQWAELYNKPNSKPQDAHIIHSQPQEVLKIWLKLLNKFHF